jgi:predicted dehydrogenase
MRTINRREFLDHAKKTGLGLAAGMTILSSAKSVRGAPANDKVVLAVAGVRGRGSQLSTGFAQRGDCPIAYVCDVDSALFGPYVKNIAPLQNGKEPRCVQDFRKALDDKSVDALVVATPDHWHALAAIWACQAGKDVYVEKPPTYCCWEGPKVIEAARKYKRIVQAGTQNRSAPYHMAAKKYLDEGKLGKVHFVRVYNQKFLPNHDRVPDADPPATFDWDMFNGPAPQAKYNVNYQRYWHSYWRYSSGDLANDGVHQLDIARWLAGVEYPKSVYCTGGRFNTAGIDETPDTQMAVFEFDKLIMTFELTTYTPYMLKVAPVIRESPDQFPYWPQCATRTEIYGSEGLMIVGRHGGGWQVFDRPKREKPTLVAQNKGKFPDPEHKENFVQCLRSRQLPNADIEKGHRSALLVHYATISYKLGGQKLLIDPKSEQIIDNPEAMKLFGREYRKPWVIEDKV